MEYGAELVQCPFYKNESKNSIRCEGVISITCSNNFNTSTEKKKHLEKHCCDKYEDCEIYKVVCKKY